MIKRLTSAAARRLPPGAIEEWVSDVLVARRRDYADEAEVLAHATFWDDQGTLVLGWKQDQWPPKHPNRWDPVKLEWAQDVDAIELAKFI